MLCCMGIQVSLRDVFSSHPLCLLDKPGSKLTLQRIESTADFWGIGFPFTQWPSKGPDPRGQAVGPAGLGWIASSLAPLAFLKGSAK